MNNSADIIMVCLILINLALLGISRLRPYIRIISLQGIIIGFLPLILNDWILEVHIAAFSLLLLGLKGVVFPIMLMRTLREINTRCEIEPFIGYGASLAFGTVIFFVCLWLGTHLTLPFPVVSSFIVPVAFFTIMSGLFLVVSRKKALTQVLGYLVMENGISIFGIAFAGKQPLIFELGILLDIFVAVFVMGIAIFNINREFDHIDTDQLSKLRS